MAEKKLSLFEFHFHDGVQFGPRTIDGLGTHDEEAADDAATSLTDDAAAVGENQTGDTRTSEGGRSVVRPLVGLGVLAAAAYVVRKLLSGEPSGLDALDDIEAEAGADSTDGSAENEEAVSIEVTSGEEASSGRTGVVAAAVVGLLVVLALVVRKLLGDAVEGIEVPDELTAE